MIPNNPRVLIRELQAKLGSPSRPFLVFKSLLIAIVPVALTHTFMQD